MEMFWTKGCINELEYVVMVIVIIEFIFIYTPYKERNIFIQIQIKNELRI